MAGLADTKSHLTKAYQYSVTGEITYGSATYENEYTYNGESYSPNIHSQYLRARYYSVVTASFLTEDSYLGSIWGPLTLNRYNYCISSYPNYEDPSGKNADGCLSPAEAMDLMYLLTGEETYGRQAEELRRFEMEVGYYEASTAAGMLDAVLADAGKTASTAYNIVATLGNACIDVGALVYNVSFGKLLGRAGYDPIPTIQPDEVDRYLERQAARVWDMDCYHMGRCGGDVLLTVVETAALYKGGVALAGKLKDGARFMSGGSKLAMFGNGTVGLEGSLSWVVDGTAILGAAEEALAGLGGYYAASDIWGSYSKIDWDRMAGNRVSTASPYDLQPTHSQTLSNKRMNALIDDIKVNGIQETIKYVEYDGKMYVVDGHHRLSAAKRLGLSEVPVERVNLPYAGYKDIEDLLWFD